MAKFVIEKHTKKTPVWLLSVLAFFPYNIKESFPNEELPHRMGRIHDYLKELKCKRRNWTESLGDTKKIQFTDNSITVSTLNDVPYITIHLIKE